MANLCEEIIEQKEEFQLEKRCFECYLNENLPRYYYHLSKHKSFFDQLNNIKTLKWSHTMDLDLLSSFDQLIYFECNFDSSRNAIFIENLNVITKHESVKNIKIKYFDHSFNINISSGIINLFKVKPNTDITIYVFFRKHLDKPNLIEYKKVADETEHLCNIKLNHITQY